MQLAKVELFGINICGQQRYSNNSNNNGGTNNNNCKSIGRNNDRPVLFVFVFVIVSVCVRALVLVLVHIVCSLFGFGLHFPICFVDYAIYLV